MKELSKQIGSFMDWYGIYNDTMLNAEEVQELLELFVDREVGKVFKQQQIKAINDKMEILVEAKKRPSWEDLQKEIKELNNEKYILEKQ